MIYKILSEEKIRLDIFLRNNFSTITGENDFSNSKVRRLIIAGCVYVNENQIRRPAFEVFPKSIVKIDFDKDKFFYEKKPNDIKFEVSADSVIFEDDYIILINKPAFFPVEETIVGAEKRDNLHDAVVRYLWSKNSSLRNPPYVGIMHRLDRETSGLILFTKQRCVNTKIHDMFESHDFKKKYKALCTGKLPNSKTFVVEKYIGRISSKSQAAKWGMLPESKGGLYSKTEFEICGEKNINGKICYIISANLFTGRTHQIRVHLSEASLPIVGDELYGGINANRIMLHAEKLEFNHPITEERLSFCAECDFI